MLSKQEIIKKIKGGMTVEELVHVLILRAKKKV